MIAALIRGAASHARWQEPVLLLAELKARTPGAAQDAAA